MGKNHASQYANFGSLLPKGCFVRSQAAITAKASLLNVVIICYELYFLR